MLDKSKVVFRAKNSSNDWVYGDYFSQYKSGVTAHYIITHPNGRDGGREMMWAIKPETLGQQTGIVDKKGNMLFEDDIVKTRIGTVDTVWQVNWSESAACWMKGHQNLSSYLKKTELLGNPYDNPEIEFQKYGYIREGFTE